MTIMYIIRCPSGVMQLRTRLSTLLQLSLQLTKDDRTSKRSSQGPDTNVSHTLKALHPHQRSPSHIVTTVLREREGSVAVRLGGTSETRGGDRGWGRRLILGAMLCVLVLFGARGDQF
jgi:hypothetical protein